MIPMENPKPQPTSPSTLVVKAANPPTSTSVAPPAAPVSTSKPSAFKDECIILVLSPKKTVHPFVKPGASGVHIFDNSELAQVEMLSNKVLQSHPSAIVPLKDLFS